MYKLNEITLVSVNLLVNWDSEVGKKELKDQKKHGQLERKEH